MLKLFPMEQMVAYPVQNQAAGPKLIEPAGEVVMVGKGAA